MINTISLVIPLLLFVVFIEWFISNKRNDRKYATGNTAMNLTIGAIDQVCSLFYYVAFYFVLNYMYTHFRLIEIGDVWYQWVLAYIAVDFLSYWYHRLSHRVNILWAGHITHHSSEFFNFTNGFRTSFFQALNRIIFWAVLPVFGFSPLVLIITFKISGLYDFLLHTEYVPKLGFLEKILVTPSQHRVHHGKNDIYIDKNYGSTFVIWDKLFGTFQEETETVQYGITSTYKDNNPFGAIGHHYYYLWKTIRVTTSWTDKIKLLFMPPEWKPASVKSVENSIPENDSPVSSDLKQYAYFQISCCVLGIFLMLTYKNYLSNWEVILCSGIGVITMANSTMIFNKNIREGFARRELARLVCGTILTGVTIFLFPNMYMLTLVVFLTISLLLTGIRSYTAKRL